MTKPRIRLSPELQHENPLVRMVFEQKQMLSNWVSSGNSNGTKTRIYTQVLNRVRYYIFGISTRLKTAMNYE